MKKGFTLIELLVTILISSFAIGVAGYVYVTAFKNDLNTRYKLRSMDDANHLMSIVLEDMGRMGNHDGLVQNDTITHNFSPMYWNLSNSDSSQFNLMDHDSTDRFIFKALRYNSKGIIIGFDSVEYRLNNGQLTRKLVFIDTLGSKSSDTTVLLADSILAFNIRLGQIVNADSSNLYTMSSSSSWVVHLDTNNPSTASVQSLNLKEGATYEVSFVEAPDTSISNNWDQIKDTFSVSMLDASGNLMHGTRPKYFYPTGTAFTHQVYFSPATSVNGASFQFKIKKSTTPLTPTVDTLRNVMVTEKSVGQYTWLSSLSSSTSGIAQKRASKALEVRLNVRIKGKSSQVVRIIPLPANQ